ncbi:MAG: histidine--tRNA ligase [Candidatus Berkelbacteria bacterium]|nr:histidine--tRNA ligase [Candidatus Berkelbacteria bacterium]
MDRESLGPLSGFRDQLEPSKSAILDVLKRIFQSYGFQELETPAIEKQEILLGNYGDEAQKLLYLFEDNGKRKVGLRYDLTVPLSRFVAANYQSLALPFKRFEIGPVFRAEKPQAGRFRQFTQADIDIVGSAGGEKEILEIVATAAKEFGLKITCVINDRRVVEAVFEDLKVKVELRQSLLRLLDKKEKITSERLNKELDDLGLTVVQKKAVSGLFLRSEEPFDELEDLLGKLEPLTALKNLVKYGKSVGLKVKFDLSMVRGLDYYTGTIFECVEESYGGGTLMGGGRYDGLVESLIGQKLPAVGISFGVDRIGEVMRLEKPETLFVVCLPETEVETRRWATELRGAGKRVEVYLDSTVELGRQIKYADKRGYETIIIPLEEAWKKGQVEIKNLETGKQEATKRDEITNG